MSDRDELERLKAELGAARKQLAGMAAPRIEAEAASWRRRLAELERRERGTFGSMNGDSQQAMAVTSEKLVLRERLLALEASGPPT